MGIIGDVGCLMVDRPVLSEALGGDGSYSTTGFQRRGFLSFFLPTILKGPGPGTIGT
jgi:hypothetical protein